MYCMRLAGAGEKEDAWQEKEKRRTPGRSRRKGGRVAGEGEKEKEDAWQEHEKRRTRGRRRRKGRVLLGGMGGEEKKRRTLGRGRRILLHVLLLLGWGNVQQRGPSGR